MLGNLINSFLPRAATVQSLGHPRAGIIGWYNPEDNVSGEVVTETTALKFAALWCGVRIIAETLASLPCILYRRESNGDKSRASDDYRYSLVHDYPCEEIDAYHFFEVSTAHQVLWGNSYGKIIRDGFNAPIEIELRLPDRMEIKRRREDGVLIYECNDPRETTEFQDMLHGTGFSFDGIKGYSLIEKAAQSLGIAIAADKHAGASLRNGNVPSGVLDMPIKLEKGPRDLLRKEWDEIHDGASKAGKLAITHGGMKYTPISMNHENAQLLESRKFSIPEIARWLRLPPHMLADLENSAVRANIEQQAMEFIQYSLTPWCKRWEGALKMKLLRREERRGMFFEFLLDSLLRGDTLTRYQAHALARQWGFKSVNEIRSTENDNGIGPNGDVYMQPMNMAPVGQPANDDIPEAIRQEYQKSHKEMVGAILDTGKQMRYAIKRGFMGAQEAFTEFGSQLHQSISSERETFRLIKDDIASLGQSVQVSVPQAIEEICQGQQVLCELFNHDAGSVELVLPAVDDRIQSAVREMLSEAIKSLLRMESSEAVKAAAGQMRGQNFIKRIEEFYENHWIKATQRLGGATRVANSNNLEALATAHCEQSKRELLDCCDGDPAGFELRVKACVEAWATERLEHEVNEYHANLFRTNDSSDR